MVEFSEDSGNITASGTQKRLSDPHRIGRASRYTSLAIPAAALPLVYGDLTLPARSEAGVFAAAQINTGGAGVWLIADHAIVGSVSLFDSDGLIAPGDYTVVQDLYLGLGLITRAAFSVAPNGPVTAVCQGKKDAAGALIENPFAVAEDLLLSVWGFSAQEIDGGALGQAKAAADLFAYKAAGVIQADRAPAEVLTELLGDFLGRFEVDARGRIRFTAAGFETGTIFPVLALPAAEAASISAETARAGVVNKAPALYARNYLDGAFLEHEDGEIEKDRASIALFGERLPEGGTLSLGWIRQAAVARAAQARIVERMKAPARIFTVRDSTWRGLPAEVDDYVSFSVPWMRTEDLEPLVNQIGQVLSVSPDLREQTLELRLRDTGFYLTRARLLDGAQTLGGGWTLGSERELSPAA